MCKQVFNEIKRECIYIYVYVCMYICMYVHVYIEYVREWRIFSAMTCVTSVTCINSDYSAFNSNKYALAIIV